MWRRGNLRNALLLVVLGSVLAINVASDATTVPLPKGVVVGRQSFSVRCDNTHCVMSRVFGAVKVVGRVKGVQLVGSATYMQYDSIQSFCPFGPCPPSTPALAAPFTITGLTAAAASFSAICTSGRFMQTIAEASELTLGIVDPPIVSASCEGGTSSAQGRFAFRFLIPEDIVTFLAADVDAAGTGSVFVAILVEV